MGVLVYVCVQSVYGCAISRVTVTTRIYMFIIHGLRVEGVVGI